MNQILSVETNKKDKNIIKVIMDQLKLVKS